MPYRHLQTIYIYTYIPIYIYKHYLSLYIYIHIVELRRPAMPLGRVFAIVFSFGHLLTVPLPLYFLPGYYGCCSFRMRRARRPRPRIKHV